MQINASLVAELGAFQEPGALLAELHRRFGVRMAIATAGDVAGSALIALAVEAGCKPRVYTLDTGRLFPETYAVFDALEKRYGISIERFPPPANELEQMIRQHGEFLFFDSKDKQEYCCTVRKVLPNQRALDTLDVWVTGLKADQSSSRAGLKRFEIIQHSNRPILKVSPILDWTEAQLRSYVESHQVPVNTLQKGPLENGWYYESVGCVICTTPIAPHEPRRAGRWRWFNAQDAKKECGLHLPQKPS